MVRDNEGLLKHANEFALYLKGNGKLLTILKNRMTWLDLCFENSILAAQCNYVQILCCYKGVTQILARIYFHKPAFNLFRPSTHFFLN